MSTMSRTTQILLIFSLAMAALTSCQLPAKNTERFGVHPNGPADPSHDPPPSNGHPGGPSGDPQRGQPGLQSISGDGQVTPTRFAFPDPLSVSLHDPSGNPIVGA